MNKINIDRYINNLNILADSAINELNNIRSLKEQKNLFNLIFLNTVDKDLYLDKDIVYKIKYHLENYCNFPNTILQKRSYKQIIYLIKLFHSKRLKRNSINQKYLENLNFEVYSIVPKKFNVQILFKCLNKKCGYSICGSKKYLSLSKVKYYLEKHNKKHLCKKNKECETEFNNPYINLAQVNLIYDKPSIDDN